MAAKREGVWVSPHFEFSKEFLKAMSGVEEVKTAPFIWTPKYMNKSLEERGFDRESFIKNLKPAGDVAVLEPNINILKTSIIPSMIIESLYNNFKVKTVNSNMNLQKLVNRAIHQYLNDEDAKELIETYDKLHLSGSQF